MAMRLARRLRRLILGLTVVAAAHGGAGAVEQAGDTFIAEKNGVALMLNGVHHGSASAAPPARVREHFAKSALVMAEMDVTDPTRRAAAAKDLRHGNGLALHKFLNQEEVATVHAAWMKKLDGKGKMTAATLGELHACGLSLMLMPSGTGQAAPPGPARTPAWEQIFLAEAKRSGKTIVELEPQGSLRVCERLTPEQVRALVLEPARLNLDDGARARYLQQADASRQSAGRGDGAASHAAMMEAIGFSAGFKSAFLHYMGMRNQAMVEVIEEQHRKLPASAQGFVLFGALHLHGPEGILALLRDKGFTVKRL